MADTANPSDDSVYDLLKEECISFAEAARKLPKVRGKKHPSPSTLWRWAHDGRRCTTGEIARLEYIKVGGTNCTSIQALARFFQRLRGEQPPGTQGTPSRPASTKTPGISKQNSPEKRAEQATEILRRRGVVK